MINQKKLFSKNRSVVLLCDLINHSWFSFLDEFQHYKVFVCMGFDHNLPQGEIDKCKKQYKNINFIEEDRGVSRISGFKGWKDLGQPGRAYAHEKALYYLTANKVSHDHIWMLDEDVFLFNEKTLINIDLKHPDEDYLTRNILCEKFFSPEEWKNLWGDGRGIKGLKEGRVYKDLVGFPRLSDGPIYQSINKATRISKLMLTSILSYAEHNHRLFFRDYYLPTSAVYNNMKYSFPIEMQTISQARCSAWRQHELNSRCIFAPMSNKKIDDGFYEHDEVRNFLFLNEDYLGTGGGT